MTLSASRGGARLACGEELRGDQRYAAHDGADDAGVTIVHAGDNQDRGVGLAGRGVAGVSGRAVGGDAGLTAMYDGASGKRV
jgi:hypothetical protein